MPTSTFVLSSSLTLILGDGSVAHDAGGYAVGWFTLSLINAGLAQSKGRSAVAWWFTSLFLGPIATLLIVVVEPVRRE